MSQVSSEIASSSAAVAEPAVKEFQTAGVVTMSAGHAIHDTYEGFLNSLLPVFIENLSLSRAEAGLLTVFSRWPSIFQPILGHLADRFHLRELFIFAPAVTAVCMSLVGITSKYVVLIFFLVMTGVSSAALHSVGPAVVGRLSGKKLGRGMGMWMVGGELGRTLGPIMIVTAIELFGIEGTPWLMTGGILTSVALWFVLRKSPPPQIQTNLAALHWKKALRQLSPLLIPLMGIILMRGFAAASLSTYLPIFIRDEGSSLWLAGASLSIYEAAGAVGAFTGGMLSDRFGRKQVMFASMLLTPLLMFLFLAAHGPARFVLLLALGFASLAISPVIMAMVQERSPENPALANGMYMSTAFLFSSGVVVVLGILGDNLGMHTTFAISAVASLVGLPLVFLLPVRRSS